ncbi:dopaminechrome tautomerase [Eurosta solidaginis]|uniref:dopaminechrome tautomerase n=1 Tax=Eurosta solidaginis TaxID=178769 RepID=UPI0035314818
MRTNIFMLLLLALMPHALMSLKQRDLETVYQWRQLVFGFPTENDRRLALANGNLVPGNAVPIDVAPHRKSRVFVTIPRFQTGIPYSLALVSDQRDVNGPILQPYPSYEWNNAHGTDCDKITSAFRVAITACNQMFVIDSGNIGGYQHCPPQLLVFDLNTDTLIQRYRFDSDLYLSDGSLFITPIVVVQDPPPKGSCQRLHVYIADVNNHGLVIYDSKLNTAWRVENKFMYPDPDHGTHTIAGDTFTLMDGIFGLATDGRQLYFHPLASLSEYAVPLSVLNNRTNFLNGVAVREDQFRLVGRRSSQCAAQAMDSYKNLYCVTFNPITLTRWSSTKPYDVKHENRMSADPHLLEFVSGMKVFRGSSGKEELWMMSNRYQKVATGTLSDGEINYRVVRRVLDDVQHPPSTHQDLSSGLIFT